MVAALSAPTSARGEASGALAGRRIVLSAGHGTVFTWADDGTGEWDFQRGIVQALREDIHNNQVAIDFLIPLLERAGATVLTVRERAYRTPEQLLDNDDAAVYAEVGGPWTTSESPGWDGGSYRFAQVDPAGGSEASWAVEVPTAGDYPVYVYFLASANRSRAAVYRVEHFGGSTEVVLDQGGLRVQTWAPGGDLSYTPPPGDEPGVLNARWHYLGTFPFAAGEPGVVALTNRGDDPDAYVIADAVRVGADVSGLTYAGLASGRPRWEESAIHHLEALGVPGWVRANDVTTRSLYAVYERPDAFLSLHTNCCNGTGTSTYVWYPEMWVGVSYWPEGWADDNLPPGTFLWGDGIHHSILAGVRAAWDPAWANDGQLGADFGELRPVRYAWANDVAAGVDPPTTIPSALIEAAFHDLPDDSRDIRELGWRQVVARAIVNGAIRYFAADPEALVPPLAPAAVAAVPVAGGVRVSWLPAPDPAEPAAVPAVYRVYTSPDGVLYPLAPEVETEALSVELPVAPCEVRYVRVAAANGAGESLPGPSVGARALGTGVVGTALWVDGIDREVKTVDDPNNRRDWARVYGPALAAAWGGDGFFASATDDAVTAGLVALADYAAVLWSVGETARHRGSIQPAERQAIAEYLLAAPAARIAVSGAEIGWDLVDAPIDDSASFLPEVMRAEYVADDANVNAVVAPVQSVFAALGEVAFGTCGAQADDVCVEWPDVLAPVAGGEVLLRYAGGEDAAAVTWQAAEKRRTATFGFPLEAVADPAQRAAAITTTLELLAPELSAVAVSCTVGPGPDAAPEIGPEPPPDDVAEPASPADVAADAEGEVDAAAEAASDGGPAPAAPRPAVVVSPPTTHVRRGSPASNGCASMRYSWSPWWLLGLLVSVCLARRRRHRTGA